MEVIPFALEVVQHAFTDRWGCEIKVRKNSNGEKFVTDNGNNILDCQFPGIEATEMTELHMLAIPGVVDTGLFIHMCDKVLIAGENGITVREYK